MWIDPDDLRRFVARCGTQPGGSRAARCGSVRGAAARDGRLFRRDHHVRRRSVHPRGAASTSPSAKRTETQGGALREELAHLGRVTMLDALTGSLAHEINQPLTAVMANAEAALRLLTAQPPRLADLRETLNEVLTDNRRAGDVVRRMRDPAQEGRDALRAASR